MVFGARFEDRISFLGREAIGDGVELISRFAAIPSQRGDEVRLNKCLGDMGTNMLHGRTHVITTARGGAPAVWTYERLQRGASRPGTAPQDAKRYLTPFPFPTGP